MIAGQMTHHPGTYPSYPGPSSQAPVLPFCLPLGAEEEVYAKGNLREGGQGTYEPLNMSLVFHTSGLCVPSGMFSYPVDVTP